MQGLPTVRVCLNLLAGNPSTTLSVWAGKTQISRNGTFYCTIPLCAIYYNIIGTKLYWPVSVSTKLLIGKMTHDVP